MNAHQLFETETMADLCERQGRLGEALAIYRKLLASPAPEPAHQQRWKARVADLEARWQPSLAQESTALDLPLPQAPGVVVRLGEDQVALAWALLSGTVHPAVELFLIQRSPAGIETRTDRLAVETLSGHLTLNVTNLHSAVAAAGSLNGDEFIPQARSGRR